MRKLKDKIPQKYVKDFLEMQTERFKSTLQLFSLLLIFLFVVGTLSINLIVVHRFPIRFLPAGLFVLGICYVAILIARKSSNLIILKVTSIMLLLISLLFVASNHLKGNAPVLMVLGFYVFMLFCFEFPFPWFPIEGLLVSGLVLFVYVLYYLNIVPDTSLAQESADFYQGVIMLFMAAAVIYFVKRNVIVWLIDTFILQKKIEEKTDKIQKDLVVATRVHRRLIPDSVSTKLADIGVSYVPMNYMGGDYAMFRFIDKNKLLFLIADITGHGVPAALLVNALNAEFERISAEGKTPGNLLKELDLFIKKDFGEIGMYLTAFCGQLDYRKRRFTYSNYGHPPQYVCKSRSQEILELYAQTSFLGLPVFDENVYENEIGFDRGDQILLFTDGVIEASNEKSEEFGAKNLKKFIIENRGLYVDAFNERLLAELKEFTGDKYKDDMFILNILTK